VISVKATLTSVMLQEMHAVHNDDGVDLRNVDEVVTAGVPNR
jgi:hypothetical protein